MDGALEPAFASTPALSTLMRSVRAVRPRLRVKTSTEVFVSFRTRLLAAELNVTTLPFPEIDGEADGPFGVLPGENAGGLSQAEHGVVHKYIRKSDGSPHIKIARATQECDAATISRRWMGCGNTDSLQDRHWKILTRVVMPVLRS